MKFCVTQPDVVRFLKHELKQLQKGQSLQVRVDNDQDGYYVELNLPKPQVGGGEDVTKGSA